MRHRFDGAPVNIAFARGMHIVMHDRCLYKMLVRFSLDQYQKQYFILNSDIRSRWPASMTRRILCGLYFGLSIECCRLQLCSAEPCPLAHILSEILLLATIIFIFIHHNGSQSLSIQAAITSIRIHWQIFHDVFPTKH